MMRMTSLALATMAALLMVSMLPNIMRAVVDRTRFYPEPFTIGAIFAVDGDTVRVDGADKSVRVLGLDTPETFQSKCPREKKWGLMARHRMQHLLSKDGRIVYKKHSKGRRIGKPVIDKYRRKLGKVEYVLNGEYVNVVDTLSKEQLGRPYSGRGRRRGWCKTVDDKAYSAAMIIFAKNNSIKVEEINTFITEEAKRLWQENLENLPN